MGIIDYDLKRLFDWVVSTLIRVKSFVDDSTATVQTLITDYMSENWSNVLKIKSTATATAADGVAPLVIPEQSPRNAIVARYEPDTSMLYIVQKPFKQWLGEQHIDFISTMDGLMEQMGAKKVKKRLCKGTNFHLPSAWTLAVKLEGLDEDVSETDED